MMARMGKSISRTNTSAMMMVMMSRIATLTLIFGLVVQISSVHITDTTVHSGESKSDESQSSRESLSNGVEEIGWAENPDRLEKEINENENKGQEISQSDEQETNGTNSVTSTIPVRTWQERKDLWGLMLSSKIISHELLALGLEELATPTMQSLFDAVPAKIPEDLSSLTSDFHSQKRSKVRKVKDWRREAFEIGHRISLKLKGYQAVLDQNAYMLIQLYGDYMRETDSELMNFKRHLPCCERDIVEHHREAFNTLYSNSPLNRGSGYISSRHSHMSPLIFDPHFGTLVSKRYSCSIVPPMLDGGGAFNPCENLTINFASNLATYPSLKWQFFLSTWGVYNEFPAYHNEEQCEARHHGASISHIMHSRLGDRLGGQGSGSSASSDAMLHFHRHRDVYLSTIVPRPKYLVIVIDRGSSLSEHQLRLAKRIAREMLNSLSHRDNIGLIALSDAVYYPLSDSCSLNEKMTVASVETKYHFARFIDLLDRVSNSTNHTLGLEHAINMVQNTFSSPVIPQDRRREASIVYISRGLLSSLTDAKLIMNFISSRLESETDYSLVSPEPVLTINAYALIDDSKPVMYETTFLRDMAHMNFEKYNVISPSPHRIRPGIMIMVNSTENLDYGITGIYSVFDADWDHSQVKEVEDATVNEGSAESHSTHTFSMPYWDPLSRDTLISITRPVYHRSNLVGITGLDISLRDLSEELNYFKHLFPASQSETRAPHAYLIDRNSGIAVWHPLMKPSSQFTDHPMHTHIDLLEPIYFYQIRDAVLKKDNGSESLALSSLSHSGEQLSISSVTYSWKHVHHTPYVLLLVTRKESEGSDEKLEEEKQSILPTSRDRNYVYHRLDYLIPATVAKRDSFCRHFRQVATLDTPALFLSSPAFSSPFRFMREAETRLLAQRYLAYLNDNTKLIVNPGLKEPVRSHAVTLSKIAPFWKKIVSTSERSKYIVRRYVATQSGVLLLYPGMEIEKTYDPTTRQWYRRAVNHAGKMVASSPYLDVGGAGYIVTLSEAVFVDSRSKEIIGVMGIDLTLGYFKKLILDYVPICSQYPTMSCFIMDDEGFLISHPTFSSPAGREITYEDQHITQIEPLLTNDLLSRTHFVDKIACNSLADRTIQRFYRFNTSFDEIISNKIHSEVCTRYQLIRVEGMNIFVGIINETCGEMLTSFCPCSVTDRLCLNCHWIERSECECPCECPLEMNLCTGKLFPDEANNPTCPAKDDHRLARPYTSPSMLRSLPDCVPVRCSEMLAENECVGVLGCEWCSRDSQSMKPLKNGGYCSKISECFGGIFGAAPPYAPEEIELPLISIPDGLDHNFSPIGPRAALVIFCLLIFGIMVAFGYRLHAHRLGLEYFGDGISQSELRANENEHEEMDQLDPLPSPPYRANPAHPAVAPAALANFPNAVAQMSPYRLNPSYRRPAQVGGSSGAGGDSSDHGYSTMTAHDDTDRVGPSIEPVSGVNGSGGRNRHSLATSTGHSGTGSTSRSSSPLSLSSPDPLPLTQVKLKKPKSKRAKAPRQPENETDECFADHSPFNVSDEDKLLPGATMTSLVDTSNQIMPHVQLTTAGATKSC